ncbi:MAG: hypothetical protein OES38_20990, partial [Gammaproteobacteria bacterium]|nr:hypothetical protein [Gammaproteobacteria bacterium]
LDVVSSVRRGDILEPAAMLAIARNARDGGDIDKASQFSTTAACDWIVMPDVKPLTINTRESPEEQLRRIDRPEVAGSAGEHRLVHHAISGVRSDRAPAGP